MQEVRRPLARAWCAALLALIVGAGVCGGRVPAQGASATLVYALGGEPKLLDPGDSSDVNGFVVQAQIYNSLVANAPGSTNVLPDLARSWTSSDHDTVWTFQLRRGVTFQDGTPCDAAAVVFNVERWWDLRSPYSFANAGRTHQTWRFNMGGFKGDPNSVLKDIAATGPYAVRFTMSAPFPDLPAVLAGDGHFGIASPAAVRADGPRYGSPSAFPVGTGPFVVKRWTPGSEVVLARNPTYWKPGLPKADGVVIKFLSDPSSQLAEVQAGTVDFTSNLLPDQLKTIQADPHLRAVFVPTTNVGFLNLLPTYAPLSKPEVRRAIAMAIDQKGIAYSLLGSQLAVNNGHFISPALSWTWSSKVTSYPYDPARAKATIADAGYPAGFDLDLWYMPLSRPYMPAPKPVAEAIGANLSTIGVRTRLMTEDWAAYLTDAVKGRFQSALFGSVGSVDAGAIYTLTFGPGSTTDLGGWTDPRLLSLLDEARRTGDRAVQVRDYARIDEIVFDDAVRIPLLHTKVLAAERRGLSGWTPSPLGSEPFESVAMSAP